MGVSRSLERLFRIRGVEEEQRRRSLDEAQAKLRSLEQERADAGQMEKQGSRREVAGLISGVIADRQAGSVESVAAQRRARVLTTRIAAAENETIERRQAFLQKRVERRQAETLMEEAEARATLESGRRSQRDTDDWYGTRNHRQGADEEI
jgi:hypothetical protein